MGFRFRRSIKLLPGVRINLSKSGLSASIGRPGATVNISERGTRGTVGIPGTGLSYSQQMQPLDPSSPAPAPAVGSMSFAALLGWALGAFFIGLALFGLLT